MLLMRSSMGGGALGRFPLSATVSEQREFCVRIQSFSLGVVRFVPGVRCLTSRSFRLLTYTMRRCYTPFRIFIGSEGEKGRAGTGEPPANGGVLRGAGKFLPRVTYLHDLVVLAALFVKSTAVPSL